MAADPIDPEVVNTGTYDDDGTGDSLRGAFDKLNLNGLTLGRHANDRENPHGVTAHQVGAYTQAEVDGLIASLGTISDLLVLLGQINAIAQDVIAAAGAADADATAAQLDRLATAADRLATAADVTASGSARTAAEAARDLAQGYRDTAKTYRDQAQAAAGSVDTTSFAKKDGSTPFTGVQVFNAGLTLPGLASDPASPGEGQAWGRGAAGLFAWINGAKRRLLDGSLFATTAEATAGTATDRVMNPAGTKEAIAALAPALATTAQAQAGTATDVVMSPARTAEAIAALGKAKALISKLAATFSAGSSFVDTGLSVTVQATATSKYLVLFSSYIYADSNSTKYWRLMRNATSIEDYSVPAVSGAILTTQVAQLIDTPGAGSVTYKVQAQYASLQKFASLVVMEVT